MSANNAADILLIEDTDTDAELVKYVFQKKRLLNPLHIVKNGVEALDFLFARGDYAHRSGLPLPALILLDLKLPKLSGHDVLKAIRSNPSTEALPVVALTSSQELQDVEACYREGVNSYVVKPIEFDQFVEAVKNVGFYWLVLNEPPLPQTTS